ncbi:heterokaryon incompatibility protein-domain-containing protein [Diaporthe sp. PMI_573]|nr:heterokaryon incompatibility protein-domain-containing protein [Diaporthaceae sp. PMI_573]
MAPYRSKQRSSGYGFCRSCDEIAVWLSHEGSTVERVRQAGSYHICDLRMADRDSNCPLCSFLLNVAVDAAGLAGLPGIARTGVYSLHASAFSAVFLDAEDRHWCSGDDNPTVFFISPLFSFGTKAKDWALRFNSCFMPLDSQPSGTFARDLSAHADLDVVTQWIQHCNRGHTHPDCNSVAALSIPEFTVIDCETRTLVTWPSGVPYVTLSYVWGMEPAEVPVDDTLPKTLPKLIEDAIMVALRLGYRYLWIDRYCIPQDDEAVKASLIRNMDKVYSESSLTIIASAAEQPNQGLVGVGVSRDHMPHSLKSDGLGLTQLFTNISDEVESSHWNTRGWTYQEGFLSNRRLLFTKSQCYFQCGELWCTEGLNIQLNILSSLKNPDHSELSRVFPWIADRQPAVGPSSQDREKQREHYFIERVREYMKRELTHDADAFDAFAGVLNYLEGTFATEFLLGNIWGLPVWSTGSRWSASFCGSGKHTLLRSLSWSLPRPFVTKLDGKMSDVATRRQGIPSWTWCGWKRARSSTRQIEWRDVWSQGNEIPAQTEIAIEYEDGNAIQWTSSHSPAELVATSKARGHARYLRVHGWLSQLLVPAACWHDSTLRLKHAGSEY